MTHQDDGDLLDGCDLDMTDGGHITLDSDIAALVLFADIDFLDPAAVKARRQEWEVLADAL